MSQYSLGGEFNFNSTNISSSKGFRAFLYIHVPGATQDQHAYIKEQLAKKLNLSPHAIPTAWGENPIDYEPINFDTNVPDSTSANGSGTGDLSLIKHLVGLFKEGRRGGFIDDENVKCNGWRYPNDAHGDHPIFSKIPPLSEVPDALRDFESFNTAIGQVIKEAQEKFPSHVDKYASNKPESVDRSLTGHGR